MPYSPSPPLCRWHGDRRAAIATVRQAHAATGRGRPLAHAYVLRVVSEYQGFVRDLHDFTGDRLVALSGADPRTARALRAAVSLGRAIDRGNATWRSIGDDFERLGIATGPAHGDAADRRRYAELIALRNALAHANDRQLARLRAAGARDTVTWARSRLPALNRQARALDRLAWSCLAEYDLGEPW